MSQVAETYFKYLSKHKNDIKREKVSVLMQVGSFFEAYGYEDKEGNKTGNVWDVAHDAMLAVASKNVTIYNNSNLQLYMAGVKDIYLDRYIDKLVDKNNWTLAIYEQYKDGKTHKRRLKEIISPGINFENENITNTFMTIYIHSYPIKKKTVSSNNIMVSTHTVHYGIYYVDCINGNSGAIELYSDNCNNLNVELSELLKIISIQNPKEVIIYLDVDKSIQQLNKKDLLSSLLLYDRLVQFIEGPIEKKYEDLDYQRNYLKIAYSECINQTDIIINLELNNIDYARIATCLGIDYISKYNKDVISNLSKLDIGKIKSDYLMLANNCLYQLDILNNDTRYKQSESMSKSLNDINTLCNELNINKTTLLDILNNTKTIIGSRKLRQYLSVPITNVDEINRRYDKIEEVLTLQQNYLTNNKDNSLFLSPLYKIRSELDNIIDIPKYMRKMATYHFKPIMLSSIVDSFEYTLRLYDLIISYNIKVTIERNDILNLLNDIKSTFNLDVCRNHWCNIENNIFKESYLLDADKLQKEIDFNKNYMDNIIKGLNNLIKNDKDIKNSKTKYDCGIKNLARYGKHIYINETMYNYLRKQKEIQLTYNDDNDDNNEIKLVLNNVEYSHHKKGYYVLIDDKIKTIGYTLTNKIEKLINYTKEHFNEWQSLFYISHKKILSSVINFIESIDIIQCGAYNAYKYNHTRPIITGNKSHINAEKIRHPIVEYLSNNKYISNDINLGDDTNGILLYGPNAAGKSTLSKSIGINIIMAQSGFYVPCSKMEYYPYHYLFTRIKNNDNLHAGLSSFQVEMRELKVILENCNESGIVLGDEILNSTNSLDATSIMSSALMTLHNRGCHFMFATHLHFLTQINSVVSLEKLKLCHMSVHDENGLIIYDRIIKDGSGPRTYAINICETMGLDSDFIKNAYTIRNDIDNGNLLKTDNQLSVDTNFKRYNYNKSNISTNKCQVCQVNNVDDVHHIVEQSTSLKNGYVYDDNGNTFHKNKNTNLVNLCKSCHKSVHSEPVRLIIEGYKDTTKGLKLSYKWVNNETNENNKNIENNVIDKYKNDNINTSDVNSKILELSNNGKTRRSIQYYLKKHMNTSLKLREIDNIIINNV